MFEGFYEETVDFLWGIRLNNNREWYTQHKDECKQYLTGPMHSLGTELRDYFAGKYPELEFNVHISRIYRDARRNYGKGPYKDYLWMTLYDARHEHWSGVPAIWFDISADTWSYGTGCWEDRISTMRKLRARIKAAPGRLLELDRILDTQTEFTLSGEYYKKQYDDCPVPELDRWYRRKGISISHEEPVGPAITGRAFGERIRCGMEFLIPYYQYICDLRSDPDPEDLHGEEEA